MIPYATTSDPSCVELTAAARAPLAPPISTETEHQVLEAQFQIVTVWGDHINQPELRLLMAQNSPMRDLFANVRRWAIRPTDDVDSGPWFIPSLPISTAAMPGKIIAASGFANIQPWAIRPTDDVDSGPWFIPSLPISTAAMPEKIIAALRLCNLDAIADRLSYLHRLVEDDQDEQSINIDSLRELALFFLSERQLVNPQIGVNPDGLAQVEWLVGERGSLAMVFLPSGFIRFAAISAPAQRGVERKSVNGTLPKSETMDAIRPFTDRPASP